VPGSFGRLVDQPHILATGCVRKLCVERGQRNFLPLRQFQVDSIIYGESVTALNREHPRFVWQPINGNVKAREGSQK